MPKYRDDGELVQTSWDDTDIGVTTSFDVSSVDKSTSFTTSNIGATSIYSLSHISASTYFLEFENWFMNSQVQAMNNIGTPLGISI